MAHRQLLTVELVGWVLNVDGDVDARREIELFEFIDRLSGRLDDINQTLVGAGLKLLHRLLVNVGRAIDR